MMNKLLHIAIFSCQKATFWMEKQLQYKIPFFTSLRLALHVWMCPPCKSYQLQSKQIDQMLSRNLAEKDIEVLENEPLKERIMAALHDNNDVS